MKKIYISGKITGTNDYMHRFAVVEEKLTKGGFEVINPAKVNGMLPPLSWEQYMAVCKVLIDFCDALYMLQGWEDSKGATIERELAKQKGKIVLYEYEDENTL